MISQFKTAQNLVAEQYERYFDMIFLFLSAKTSLPSNMWEVFYIIFPH